MKKLALGILAAIGLSTAAQAADMAVKARPAPVMAAPIYDWSGIYIGGSVGWRQDDFDWAFAPPIPGAPHQFYGLSQNQGTWGVHGGIQKQWGQFVLGAEIGWVGNFNNDGAVTALFGNNGCCNSEVRIRDGIFEAGIRAGIAYNNWLFYGTGGYAGANIDSRGAFLGTNVSFFPASAWHDGWYAGAGVEYAFNQNWIVGAEYQHIWLDTQRHCPGNPPATAVGVCTGAALFVDRDIRADIDMVRVRLSYKFNPWPAAVVARY